MKYFLVQVLNRWESGVLWTKVLATANPDEIKYIDEIAESFVSKEYLGFDASSGDYLKVNEVKIEEL